MKYLKKFIIFFLIIVLCYGIIFLITSYISTNANGNIVEGEPLYRLSCSIQPKCKILENTVNSCIKADKLTQEEKNKLKEHEDQITYSLIHWKGYKGCNSSTNGYIKGYKESTRDDVKQDDVIIADKCYCSNWITF